MKKIDKKIYILIAIFIIAIIVLITYSIIENNETEIFEKKYNEGIFYQLETNEEIIEDAETIVKTQSELDSIITNTNIKDLNFDKYNYALFEIQMNMCGERDVNPVGYLIENNKLIIKVDYYAQCGVCAPEYKYYLLELPKDEDNLKIDYYYHAKNKINCPTDVSYKPMIYLYPEKETNIEIKLGHPELLTSTYPKYINNWQVTAYPDGTLKANDREYYGLFWEGYNHKAYITDEGFIVEGKDVEHFLEEKLEILGLNNKEANEFIIYWLPKLENNKYNYIRFESLEEMNNYMPLIINPEPETIIRIQMDYKPLDKKITIKEQELVKQERKGYTLIEWGGSPIA